MSFSRESHGENKHEPQPPGILTIIVGPTAAGKTEVLKGLLEQNPNTKKVVSTTTRSPREINGKPIEHDGIDYHFMERVEFELKAKQEYFLESNNYGGDLYGCQPKDLLPVLSGQDLLWIINMGRAVEIEKHFERTYEEDVAKALIERAVVAFIGTPSIRGLRRRFMEREGKITKGAQQDFMGRVREDWQVWQDNPEKLQNMFINYDGKLQETIDGVAGLIERRRTDLQNSPQFGS